MYGFSCSISSVTQYSLLIRACVELSNNLKCAMKCLVFKRPDFGMKRKSAHCGFSHFSVRNQFRIFFFKDQLIMCKLLLLSIKDSNIVFLNHIKRSWSVAELNNSNHKYCFKSFSIMVHLLYWLPLTSFCNWNLNCVNSKWGINHFYGMLTKLLIDSVMGSVRTDFSPIWHIDITRRCIQCVR